MRYNHLEYLVKWKGYDESHKQWEEHMQLHAKSKIVQFHHKHPGAAHHINVAIFDSILFTRADLATSWQSSHVVTPCLWRGGDIRGHLSISLPYLLHPRPSSPTLSTPAPPCAYSSQ
jgi:hypothetical protein